MGIRLLHRSQGLYVFRTMLLLKVIAYLIYQLRKSTNNVSQMELMVIYLKEIQKQSSITNFIPKSNKQKELNNTSKASTMEIDSEDDDTLMTNIQQQ